MDIYKHPDLIALCENCTIADCKAERCKLYKGELMRIRGMTERKHKPRKLYEYEGKRRTVAEICTLTGLRYTTLYHRLYRGDTLEQALKPHRKSSNRPNAGARFMVDGVEMSVRDICNATGLSVPAVWGRIYRGWSFQKIFDTPVREKRKHERVKPCEAGIQ